MLSESTEYVHVPITGPTAATLTAANIEINFSTIKTSPDGVWHPAALYQGQVAKVLVGPASTINLAEGTWHVFGRVTDTPEIPVLYAGSLKVT